MWLPRYAYNEQGEILHIKQGCSVAGSWTIPEIFAYETDKMDFSLAGVWVEYKPLSSTNEVTTKINNMTGEDNKYGFIANTKSIAMTKTDLTAIEKYIVGVSVYNDLIIDTSNLNRTILKITNTNQTEPIKAKAYYDAIEEKIKIEVTYRTNAITQILDKKEKILSQNSTTADTGDELIGNGTYKYIIIDNLGNIKEIKLEITGLSIYIIPDLETLKNFRDEVNAGNTFNGVTVYQTADIAMNEGKYTINEETGEITFAEDAEQWIPIGTSSFEGIYDGMEHTISGIYINSASNSQGLFGYVWGSSNNKQYTEIKNLTVDKSYIKGKDYVGGIVGRTGQSVVIIKNCHNKAQINGNMRVGGIVGQGVDVIDCTNTGLIYGTGYLAAGIVGDTYGSIENCHNYGNITSTTSDVAGIVSSISSISNVSKNHNIKNCTNSGTIKSETGYRVGGICARLDKYLNIINCANTGEIIGKQEVAGIVGRASGTGNMNIEYCYNTGKITATSQYVGGIGGYIYKICIKNCYNTGEIIAEESVAGILRVW